MKNFKQTFMILCTALAGVVGCTVPLHRRLIHCSMDRQRLLALTTIGLKDKVALTQKVSHLKDALEGVQQEHLRVTQDYAGVLVDHLQVLRDLNTLHENHVSQTEEHVALMKAHRDLQADHDSLKEKYRAEQNQRQTLLQQHMDLKKDHIRLQQETDDLKKDLSQRIQMNHKVVNTINAIQEEWQQIETARNQHQQSLELKSHEMKMKMEAENEHCRQELQDTKQSFSRKVREMDEKAEKEKAQIKEQYDLRLHEAQEEKSQIREYHERAVYVASLTIDRLKQEIKENQMAQPTNIPVTTAEQDKVVKEDTNVKSQSRESVDHDIKDDQMLQTKTEKLISENQTLTDELDQHEAISVNQEEQVIVNQGNDLIDQNIQKLESLETRIEKLINEKQAHIEELDQHKAISINQEEQVIENQGNDLIDQNIQKLESLETWIEKLIIEKQQEIEELEQHTAISVTQEEQVTH